MIQSDGNPPAPRCARMSIMFAVTTGNSLTVYATLRTLDHYCEALGIDPAKIDHFKPKGV